MRQNHEVSEKRGILKIIQNHFGIEGSEEKTSGLDTVLRAALGQAGGHLWKNYLWYEESNENTITNSIGDVSVLVVT